VENVARNMIRMLNLAGMDRTPLNP
jgi:hypothetical protein